MKPAAFELVLPDSLAAAHAALAGGSDASVLLAGGQSLVPRLSQRLLRPDLVVDLNRVAGFRRLERRDAMLHVGAGVTHSDLEDLEPTDRLGTILSEVALGIGSRGIRNRATVAGCLANGDPVHDWQVVLPALGARIRVETSDAAREVAAAQWLVQPFRTALRQREIITAIRIPQPPAGWRWGYVKLTQKMNAATLALAAVLVAPGGGPVLVAIGSALGVAMLPCGPVPPMDDEVIAAAIATAQPAADPLLCAMIAAAVQGALARAAA